MTRPSETREWRLHQEEAIRWLQEGHPVCLTLEAPLLTPEVLVMAPPSLSGTRLSPTVFWHDLEESGASETVVGLGTFAEVSDVWGNTSHIEGLSGSLLARMKRAGAQTSYRPRVFAAIGFTPRRAPSVSSVWQDLGTAWGCLPRLTYVRRTSHDPRGSGSQAWFCLSLAPNDLSGLEQMLEQLQAQGKHWKDCAPPVGVPVGEPASQNQTASETWQRWVQEIVGNIRSGRFRKVVAARYAALSFDEPVSAAHTLQALGEHHPTSTRFAFFRGSSVFLGATPERLVTRHGLCVETAALAGTIWPEPGGVRRGVRQQPPEEAETGPSSVTSGQSPTDFGPKEYTEHSPVLWDILEKLKPLCSQLSHDSTPSVRAQRGVSHLRTAVRGVLKSPRHVLSLVQALHPTPAVGGDPTAEALNWIAEHEDFERGLYAGPVGWFDAEGDGHFDVALRSGVVQGAQLTLFAGAGIVAGSEPEREFVETAQKMHVLLNSVCRDPALDKVR